MKQNESLTIIAYELRVLRALLSALVVIAWPRLGAKQRKFVKAEISAHRGVANEAWNRVGEVTKKAA